MALERFLGPLAIVAACGLSYHAYMRGLHQNDLEPNEEEEWSPGNEQPEEADRGAFGAEIVDRRLQDAEPRAAHFVVVRHVQMQKQICAMLNLIDWDVFCAHGHSNASGQSFSKQLANHVTWSAASKIMPGPMMQAADLVLLGEAMQTFVEATTNGGCLQQAASGAKVVMSVIHIFTHYFPQQTNADESVHAFFGPAAHIIDRAGKILCPIYRGAGQILRQGLEMAELQVKGLDLLLSDADERSRGLEAELALSESKQQQLIADKQVQDEIIQQLLSRRRSCTGRRNMANTLP
jgi:hypothetical protein